MAFNPLRLQVQLFVSPADAERSRRALTWLMFGLVAVNREWIMAYPETPPLYATHVLYEGEVNTEDWQDIPTTFARGVGDCEDLACWRCAELQVQGVAALPYVTWRQDEGRTIYHALVRWPDGRIEDPSRALGMHGHAVTRAPVFIGVDPPRRS